VVNCELNVILSWLDTDKECDITKAPRVETPDGRALQVAYLPARQELVVFEQVLSSCWPLGAYDMHDPDVFEKLTTDLRLPSN
jgi:hypothetical protein